MVAAAADSGILSRRRAAGRAHLRRRDRAAACAVRLRRRVLVRDAGRGGRDRDQPRASARGCRRSWWPRSAGAIAFVRRRARRSAELRAAAFARGVAGVRAHEGARVEGSRFAKCCGPTSGRWRVGVAVLAATAGFNGLFFAHMAAYMSGVLGYDPRQAVISQTIGVVVHALAIRRRRTARRPHPSARAAARRLARAGRARVSVLLPRWPHGA